MMDSLWLWIGFNVFVLAMLALDLGVFHRKAHVVTFKESIAWTIAWVAMAMLFNLGIAHYLGNDKGLEFSTVSGALARLNIKIVRNSARMATASDTR